MNIVTTILKKQKFRIILAFLVNICLLAIVFIWNKYLAELINCISKGQKPPLQMIVSLVTVLVLYTVFSGLSSFTSTHTCETINFYIRQNFIESITSADTGFYSGKSAGGEASGFLNEVTSVCSFISSNLFFILESAVKFAGTFAWLIYLNPFLALTSNFPSVLVLIYVTATSKVVKKYTVAANTEKSKLNGITENIMTLFPVIRLYDAWAVLKKSFDGSIKKWENVMVESEKKHSLLLSISAVLTCIPLMLTVWIGGILVVKGKLTLGELYIFINLSGNVSGILMNMPSFIGQFRVFAGNLEKLNKTEQIKATGKNLSEAV